MVVMPITSDESFAAPQHRMALEPSDEGFGFTGLRAQVSWACPTGIFATDVSAARMKHGFLPGFYREIAQQLLSDAMIAAIVRKRLGI